MQLCVELCRYASLVRYMCLHVPVVNEQLQDPRTLLWNDRNVPFAEDVKEETSNPGVLQRISKKDQKCTESLENLLSSKVAEGKIINFWELRNFQCRFSPRSLDFNTLHSLFRNWTYRCRNVF